MQQLKRKVRKSALSLQQVIHRVLEESNIQHDFSNITNNDPSVKLLMEHFNGPLTNDCTSPQYKKIQANNYCLDITKRADRFVELKNNIIVEIKNLDRKSVV